jgi:hypothetical protein|tara:strand:- start:432 stop:1181 length:750 start_codon:yes stop_codon:yes gene_type:complete
MERAFVIPSYDRPLELKTKTLATLKRHGIDKENIWVFVANDNELKKYEQILDPETYKEIKVGEKGIRNQRKYISKFFKTNIHIISMDDDIEEFYFRLNDKEQEVLKNLNNFINDAENQMKGTGAYLWGVYPVNNPYFKPKLEISTDLQFIIGVFHGYINRHEEDLYPNILSESKEDYEQSILFYKKDKSIIRFNNIRFKTKFNAVGGLGKDRFDMNKKAQDYLKETYPTFIKSWDRKCGTPEVKFLKQK